MRAEEVALQTGLDISDEGTPVSAVKGDEFSVKGDKSGIVITYSRKCEFFRGISYIPALLCGGNGVSEKAKFSTPDISFPNRLQPQL